MTFNIKKYLSLVAIVFCLGATLTACGESKTETKVKAETEATDKTETPVTQVEETKGKKDSKMDDSKSASEKAGKDDKKDKNDNASKKKQIKELEKQKLGVLPTDETNCPKNAPVKGKITKKHGDVYHLADSENYASIKPDICFSTKEDAEKAKFKASKANNN